jgi:Fe-S-cluster-containing dehydrogenase component
MKPVFVIDINKCVGCRACVAACVVEHGQVFTAAKPANRGKPQTVKLRTWVEWREYEDPPARRFVSSLCYHCEDTPCQRVCPTGATYKTPEGVVLVDKDLCIGCGYCIIACPYGSRYRPEPHEWREAEEKPLVKEAEAGAAYGGVLFKPPVPNKWAFRVDAVDKCTFCYHRYKGDGKLWTPACVEVCPTGSRLFGDLDDPSDPVAELVRRGVAKLARPDLKTGGRVYYVGGL